METMVLGEKEEPLGKKLAKPWPWASGHQGKNPMAIRRACVDLVFGENSEP